MYTIRDTRLVRVIELTNERKLHVITLRVYISLLLSQYISLMRPLRVVACLSKLAIVIRGSRTFYVRGKGIKFKIILAHYTAKSRENKRTILQRDSVSSINLLYLLFFLPV